MSISFGLLWVTGTLGLGIGFGIAAVAIVNPLVLLAAWFTVFSRVMRGVVRTSLRECSYNVCVRCGYLLDGLPESTPCPECGRTQQTPLGEAAG